MEAALLGATLTETVVEASESSLPRPVETRRGDMLYRAFGKTGETVSVMGVGGSHIGQTSSDDLAVRLVRTAISIFREATQWQVPVHRALKSLKAF